MAPGSRSVWLLSRYDVQCGETGPSVGRKRRLGRLTNEDNAALTKQWATSAPARATLAIRNFVEGHITK